MKTWQVNNQTFKDLTLNKMRAVYGGSDVHGFCVGDVIQFERKEGSSTIRRRVCHINTVGVAVIASIEPA